MKNKLIIIFTCLLLSSCQKEEIKTEQSNNPNIKLELLFEKDGCKMYRFSDGTSTVYWSNCQGETTEFHRRQSGKGSYEVETDEITSKQQ